MTYLLTHFDDRKQDLSRQIQFADSIDEVLGVVNRYLKGLYRDMTGFYPVEQYRQLGFFLDALQVCLQTLLEIGCRIDRDAADAYPYLERRFGNRSLSFGLIAQAAITLAMIFWLMSSPTVGDRVLFSILLIISMGITGFLLATHRKPEIPRKRIGLTGSGMGMPVQIQTRMEAIPIFLNHIADALDCGDRMLQSEPGKNQDDWMTQQTGMLTLFQDFLEARYFNDGQWALKKVTSLRAILQANGISVEDYDPQNPECHSHFDIEPCVDESIRQYMTIRPALVRDNQVLLRGRAAEPIQ